MDRAIFTIKMSNSDKYLDLELPLHTKINILKQLLITSLANSNKFKLNNQNYNLFSTELNRTLGDNETLAENSLWEGSTITLV